MSPPCMCARPSGTYRVPGEEEWLLIEGPQGQKAPTKYYLSSLPGATPLKQQVRLAKLRWRVERDSQELKAEGQPGTLRGPLLVQLPPLLHSLHHGPRFPHPKPGAFPPEANTLDAVPGASPHSSFTVASYRLLSALPA
jgi:hypothetical protein